jgi:hypothetical protein
MLAGFTKISHSPRAAYRKLTEGAGAVVLHLETASYHGLNEMGDLIWTLIEDGITFDALVSRVRERIDDAPPSMEQEVSDFLELMEERDLVVLTKPEDQSI